MKMGQLMYIRCRRHLAYNKFRAPLSMLSVTFLVFIQNIKFNDLFASRIIQFNLKQRNAPHYGADIWPVFVRLIHTYLHTHMHTYSQASLNRSTMGSA